MTWGRLGCRLGLHRWHYLTQYQPFAGLTELEVIYCRCERPGCAYEGWMTVNVEPVSRWS